MPTQTINLETYRVEGSKVFTGRDRGRYVREKSKIDQFIENGAHVEVIIPDNIYAIIPSFFEELFINVVSALGRNGFAEMVEVKSEGNYRFETALEEAVDRILRKNNALG